MPNVINNTPKDDPIDADPSERSAGMLETNAPKIIDDMPANTDIIPRIIVRKAIMVTPIGRLIGDEVNMTMEHLIVMVKKITVIWLNDKSQ
ncbi:MAG TPA: hypothetical protein VH415_10325 [Nitrososphaeraceae archaeon]|jgi:hypothetical protein